MVGFQKVERVSSARWGTEEGTLRWGCSCVVPSWENTENPGL